MFEFCSWIEGKTTYLLVSVQLKACFVGFLLAAPPLIFACVIMIILCSNNLTEGADFLLT